MTPSQPENLASNIWKYAVFLISNKRIFAAILGAYYLTIPGVAPQEIGILLMVGSVCGFVFEIPSGYLSDKMGHKAALVFSRIAVLASTALFLFAESLALLILGSVFLSLSFAFMSGTGSAFMHETLRGLGRDKEYGAVMGKISSVGFAIPIIFTALVPFLVEISFKAPFVVALVIDCIGLLTALSFVTPQVPQQEIEEIRLKKFKAILKEGQSLNFFIFALFAGILSGSLWTFGGFRAPYQMVLGVPVIWFGVLHGIGRVGASLLLSQTGRLQKYFTLFKLYRLEIWFYGIMMLLLGVYAEPWFVVAIFILVNAVQWGTSRLHNAYMVGIIASSNVKATLLSVYQQMRQIMTGVTAFGLGLLIERFSYQTGFMLLGAMLFVVLTPIYLYLTKRHQAINERVSVAS